MSPPQQLTILQMNDTHGYLDLHQELFWEGGHAVYRPAGGYARIATLVQQIRNERPGQVLLYDNGDTLHGTYPAVQTEGLALLPILNALHPDAMTAHWEFAYGPQTFKARAAALSYPVLAANVHHQATGAPFFARHVVQEAGGVRVGVVGLASNIVDTSMPASFSSGLRFSLGREELAGIVASLRSEERVDLVVLLSHLGFPQDMHLLTDVPGIDICLSGHTHNRLFRPVVQGQTLVIQSGCHGSFLGRLDLEIADGKVVDYQHELLEVAADVPPDPEVDGLVRQALEPFREQLSEVVGTTLMALHRGTTLEATMDNFLLQAVLEASGAELAFSNGWRYGAPIVPGTVTLNDLYNIIPMNPAIATVELTGAELLAMLEENLERTFAANPYDQMGGYVKRALGLTVLFKIENPPGQRIHKLFIGAAEAEAERVYVAAFVTEQGVPQQYGRHRRQHAERAVSAMRTYLAEHGPLQAELRNTFLPV
ncbi:MAG: bifunctional metallophosphatase/5'-nucleotidase [Herpetosiphon sp.]